MLVARLERGEYLAGLHAADLHAIDRDAGRVGTWRRRLRYLGCAATARDKNEHEDHDKPQIHQRLRYNIVVIADSRGIMSFCRGSLPSRVVLVVIVTAGLAAGCSRSATQDRGYITGEGVIEEIRVADRVPMPRIAGDTLDGGHFDSRDYAGKVLVINVWGSWCPPCRKEAPGLRKVSNEFRSKGVQFVGIDVRDDDASARAFERKFGITYPSITTADSSQALLAFGSILPRNAIPSTVVVDRKGRVAARVVGRTTYITLRDLVQATLGEK